MEGIPNEKLTEAKINLLLLEIYDDQTSNLNRPKSPSPVNRCPNNLLIDVTQNMTKPLVCT